jgi:hypothetical protein
MAPVGIFAIPVAPGRSIRYGAVWLFAWLAGVVTAGQLEMISTGPEVMHGQAVIAGTRVPSA